MHTILLLAAIYGSLNAQTNFISAPPTVVVDGGVRVTVSITEPQANALGYKLLVDERPACASNEYAVAVGYTEDTRIRRVYEKRIVTPPPRVYYRYDVSQACYEANFLDQLIAYIEADTYIKWFWNCSNKVEETNPLFIEATNKVIKAGVDEAKVKAILNRAYELGQTTSVEMK